MTRLPPIGGMRTQNQPERIVAEWLMDSGYKVVKNGWPDFLAYNREGEVRFVEVKPSCQAGLSFRQRRTAEVLSSLGITVEIASIYCSCGRHSHSKPTLREALTNEFEQALPVHDGSHPDCFVCHPLPREAVGE